MSAATALAAVPDAVEAPDLRAEPDYYDLIDLAAVIAVTGLSKSTIYAKIKADEFPVGRSCGPQAVRWFRGEVRAWNRARPPACGAA